jgi:hypothetical protein
MQNKIVDTRPEIKECGGMIMNRPAQNAVVGKQYPKEYWRCQCPEPKELGGQRSRLEWCNDCNKII